MPNFMEDNRITAARAGNQHEFSNLTEPYRRELQLHCYRLLGSLQDAEDLVQETLLRAWRRLDTFEGRASLRAWLYKIATNACLDALDKRPKRLLPVSIYPAADPNRPIAPPILDPIWLEPYPDERLPQPTVAGPETRYALRESVTLAFLTALQLLPPRQRAVLILGDVLDWRANEVAELLETTVSAVNSALHRARVTLAKHYQGGSLGDAKTRLPDETVSLLLNRYVQAWETADIAALTALLKEDASLTMPPSPSWYYGRDSITAFLAAVPFAGATQNRYRLQPAHANTQPAFALYQYDEASDVYQAFAILVLTIDPATNQIADITHFINPALFPHFGLPQALPA